MIKLSASIVRFLTICTIFFAGKSAAQIHCASDGDEEAYETLVQKELKLVKTTKNVRSTSSVKYRVAIRATVFNEFGATSPKFSTDDVLSLINHANGYFKNINVEFYLQDNQVSFVNNSAFVNFKTKQEATLRSQFDVPDAINLYLFRTISDENDVFLNGTAALPNLSLNSNRIFLSYLDRNPEDFETLKNKVFLHELGHYFGLLHTFQDGNNAVIGKRELVLRDLGTGGNCDITGDLLCDTPADPFERLTIISSYDCGEKLPNDFTDALGYRYQPPIDNIMSYHVRCGNAFTPQQYQRMEASFNVRFSPNAAYRLIANPTHNLAFKPLGKKQFCAGESIQLSYETFGDFNGTDNFRLEISDKNGENFSPTAATFLNNREVSFILPQRSEAGSNYRLRIVSTFPEITGLVSESFSVDIAGSVTLLLSQPVIRPATSTTLAFAFDGNGPWKVVMENGVRLDDIQGRVHNLRVQPAASTVYKIQSVTGKCGNVRIANEVTLTVAEPAIKVKPGFKTDLCQATYFQLPLDGLKNYGTDTPYRIRLANADTTITLKPVIFQDGLYALVPDFVPNRSVFRLMVDGPAVDDFSNAIEISFRPKAAVPTVTSPIRYCFNAISRPLQAFGVNLKWYGQGNELISTSFPNPATTTPGLFSYYVTQSNQWGCESNRSEIQVLINTPVTASLSGDNVINFGEKTDLTVRFTGDAPWKVELSNGEKISSPSVIFRTTVSPRQTETYTIVNAANTCGDAAIEGSAKVVVLQPLGIENELLNGVSFFPNPAAEVVNLNVSDPEFLHKLVEVEVVDLLGRRKFIQQKLRFNSDKATELNVHNLESGSYILRLKSGDTVKSSRLLIQK